ncbi:MAG: acyloxyacyl hydrolase [Sphingomonas fennica]
MAAPAAAAELFAGVLVHGVGTPATEPIYEGGADLNLGIRAAPVATLWGGRIAPYLLGSVNTAGDTDFAAAGLSWEFGRGRWFARPGLGLAVHDGPHRRERNGFRTDLGSRILFEPELSVGYRLTPRAYVEASWVHLSHAQWFSPQNPGLDMIGLRVGLATR